MPTSPRGEPVWRSGRLPRPPPVALAFFTLKLPNNARDLDLHPDGQRLAVPFFDGAVRLYDLTPKKPA